MPLTALFHRTGVTTGRKFDGWFPSFRCHIDIRERAQRVAYKHSKPSAEFAREFIALLATKEFERFADRAVEMGKAPMDLLRDIVMVVGMGEAEAKSMKCAEVDAVIRMLVT